MCQIFGQNASDALMPSTLVALVMLDIIVRNVDFNPSALISRTAKNRTCQQMLACRCSWMPLPDAIKIVFCGWLQSAETGFGCAGAPLEDG